MGLRAWGIAIKLGRKYYGPIMEKTRKTIGVLGGMGPEATAMFFSKLVEADTAGRDQDHIHIVVECDPSIPDRTAHLVSGGADPLPAMIRSTERLEAAGAEICGIPCMTAHAFLPRLRAATRLRFVSALEVLAERLDSEHPSIRKLGILATLGSRQARIYEDNLPGFEILWPSAEEHSSLVMEAIYGKEGIKAGNRGEKPKALLLQAAESLRRTGAQAIVAGCTEVPLAISQEDLDVLFLDPMDILARALVDATRSG
ncbi:MAG TPA: amino acid racemase [Rectinemataceae bacterium]